MTGRKKKGQKIRVHACKTYFSVDFEIDRERNAALAREKPDCTPEELGIFTKDEAEKYIVETFGVTPIWDRHRFVLGYNEQYDVDVNRMLRVTLRGLLGKEAEIRALQEKFGVTTMLEIVPYIVKACKAPTQILAPDKDIVAFLHTSDTEIDIDYYIF